MNKSKHSQFSQELDARVARFGLRVAAGLSEGNQSLPHDVSERLRHAREQAMLKAKAARAEQAQVAPSTEVMHMGSAAALRGGTGSPRWLKLASLLPILLLLLGLLVIHQGQLYEQIKAAAEVDTALLADHLPPSAYSDPGFSEYLSDEEE